MRALIALIVLLGLNAHGMEMANPDFENLKNRLLGTWTFIEDNKRYEATFEAVSHGSALLERNSGFIAVYHSDGDSMVMTLYTRDGNQPRFRATGFEGKPQFIRFVFQDITNWKSGTEHINGLEIVFKDRDHVIEKWETLRQDGRKLSFEFELIRKDR
jgi:lipoate-protein ligase A